MKSVRYGVLAMFLVLGIVFQPWRPISRFRLSARGRPDPLGATQDHQLFLPVVVNPPGPPAFEIAHPGEGWTISGTLFFAVQVNDPATVSTLSFRAGGTDLGTDATPEDGYRVFLDAKTLPAGPIQLSATATGPTGQRVTQTVNVTVQPNPPGSATLGSGGGALASEIGSVITVPPGAAPAGTDVAVAEKTQAQVTADNGIDWEALGVTFLGAQAIQSSAPFSRPLGVSSAGFGNRVQPGQVVVNYSIVPDTDGDGVDEIVVLNTASVAPNDDVISDPVPQPAVNGMRSGPVTPSSAARDGAAGISGPPGTLIHIEVSGFNPFSLFGNVAIFHSSVDGTEFEMTGFIDADPADPENDQVFNTMLPGLPAGPATLVLRNGTTGLSTPPIDIEVTASPPLSAPAYDIVMGFVNAVPALLSDYADGVDLSAASPGEQAWFETQKSRTLEAYAELKAAFEALDPADTNVQQGFTEFATLIQNAGLSGLGSTRAIASPSRDTTRELLAAALWAALAGTGSLIIAGIGFDILNSYIIWAIGMTFGPPLLLFAALALGVFLLGTVLDAITGMGSAPPSGGAAGGSVALPAAAHVANGVASRSVYEPGRVVVKVFSGSFSTPFTGLTDPGGYFSIPLIPQGEPFTALAIDTQTGQLRLYEDVGPAESDAVWMYFDFVHEAGAPQSLRVGDVITGAISAPGEVDFYSFTATAGEELFFDSHVPGFSSIRWELRDQSGTRLFSDWVSNDQGVLALGRGGTYIVSLKGETNAITGTYAFQLWDVPPPDRFAISVGDTVSPGSPGPGAGEIETPGVKDVYTFSATPGQEVFFDSHVPSFLGLEWSVQDETGSALFTEEWISTDPGLYTLDQGGTYTLTVGQNTDITGTYSFQLWDVPAPETFAISIGDGVSPGSPGPGAGEVETPGAQDIYSFDATAGQVVLFDSQVAGFLGLEWRVLDPDQVELGSDFVSTDIGPLTLAKSGTHTVVVGQNTDVTGTYKFRLVDQTP